MAARQVYIDGVQVCETTDDDLYLEGVQVSQTASAGVEAWDETKLPRSIVSHPVRKENRRVVAY